MNRHHPYGSGGGYENNPNRRGGSPGGPGPDRAHRFSHDRGGRGRGNFGRGRGGNNNGHGAYDTGPSPYDQGPPDGDMGYNNYPGAPPPLSPETFYQNGYGASPPPPPPMPYAAVPDHSGGYEQDYPSYEDASGSNYDQGGYDANLEQKRGLGQRREREDKVHDSIIEERIQRERPCRTLFIRNIKYETNSEDIRRMFEEHGEIKTFFDLISNRGMVFVTYHDLRAAERARERLQGSEISGRPIDVHYSLPRDDHSKGQDRDKNQALQGTLLVTLRDSMSGQPIDDNEVRRKFQQFGDVKSVAPASNVRDDQRYVEFYDVRAAEESYDRLRHQSLQDGVMEIVLCWDIEDNREARGREWEDLPRRGRGGRGRGRGARGRGGNAGPGPGPDEYDRRAGDEYGRDRDRGRPFENDYGRGAPSARGDRFEGRGGRGGRGRGGNNAYNQQPQDYSRSSQDYGPPPPQLIPNTYGPPASAPASYAQAPPPATVPPVDDRLEQARKVQQLLAALKQVPPNAGMPNQQPTPMPPMPQQQAQMNYYQQPPPMNYPPPNGSQYPSQTSTPQPLNSPSSSQAYANLPPNILALIQQSSNAPGYQQGASPQIQNGPSGYNMPPASAMNGGNPGSYSYLGKHAQ